MSTRATTAAAIALVAGLAFVAGRASDGLAAPGARAAQPEGDGQMMMQPPAPGPMHKHLEQTVGDWEGAVRMQMVPDTPWMESPSTIKREMIMDGRFVIEHVTGDMPGQTFKGLGIVGYSDIAGHYESVWIENMATHMSIATGSYDADSGVFTFKGDMLDPMSGENIKTVMTLHHPTPAQEVIEGFILQPDGYHSKYFEGKFTRAGN